MKYILKLAKLFYRSLPLSNKAKTFHRNLFSRYIPKLMLSNSDHPTAIPAFPLNIFEKETPDQFLNPADFSKTIEIPFSENPLVSVVIPAKNEIHYALRCLVSIASNPPQSTFEVVIIGGNLPDNSTNILKMVSGVRWIQNNSKHSLIQSCNIGAKAAMGQYLYFLDDRAEVMPGWMDELIHTFNEFSGTGLVGSKLIYPVGILRETSTIISLENRIRHSGRHLDPLHPSYNFAKEIDECSWSSMMVLKSLFDEIAGFDTHNNSAYTEDCDLFLKIRNKGYRVIYQPLSTISISEEAALSNNLNESTNSYKPQNSKTLSHRLKNRWKMIPPVNSTFNINKSSYGKRRVLVIDHFTPTPNQDAGSLLFFNFMLLLRQMDFQVTFIPEDNFLYMSEYTTALQRAGIEALYAPYITSIDQYLKEFGNQFSAVFLFRPYVYFRNISPVRKFCPQAKIIYHTLDLHFVRMFREAELHCDKSKQIESENIKQIELEAIRTSDASIVVSTSEFERVHQLLPDANQYVFPLILDVRNAKNVFENRNDIVFVGNFAHPPNVDAVLYFITQIMPFVLKRLPDVRFYVIGKNPPVEIKALSSNNVIVTGFIEDLNSFLDKMRVSVAPLRFGAGIKGKIASAMAAGLPVVATSLAVEGMNLTNNENILIANDAEEFAETIVWLYQEETLWNQISKNGQEFAKNTWGAEAAWKNLSNILSGLGIQFVRSHYPLSLYSGSNSNKFKPIVKKSLLTPIASFKKRSEFKSDLPGVSLYDILMLEEMICDSKKTSAFSLKGFCVPCSKEVPFLISRQLENRRRHKECRPNWCVQLVCPQCGMNNRQRLVATLLINFLKTKKNTRIYFMEYVSPLYKWAVPTYNSHEVLGSEYLGPNYKSGAIIQGIRHEDVKNLSFSDDSLDLIVSNNVFGHVPNPSRAFSECARALNPDGLMLSTIPFCVDNDISVSRSKIIHGQLEHILPPIYHGNPVSSEGSLVFTDFGWDVLDTMAASGFSDVRIEIYSSSEYGHLGNGNIVFIAKK